MMKIFNFILIYCTFVCFAVDRSNFKTCSQSGFCKRQREYQSGQDKCSVVRESISIQRSRVYADIHCETENIDYKMELHKLQGHLYRLKINVKNSLFVRFEPKIEDVLVKEPVDGDMKATLDKELGIVMIQGDQDDKGILYLNPFKLDLYLNDEPLLSVNSRDLLRLEGSIKATSVPGDNNTEVPPINYHEEFKGHTDTQPRGFASVAMDITLPGFQYVYGIPEHADKFALRNTDSTDPYRLFNLDVFEYELNNPMALYGSVPLMLGHNINHTVGIFWNNPTETWIDIHSSLESLSSFDRIVNFVKRSELSAKVDTHWMSETGVIDLFLMIGDNPMEIYKLYGQLTGTTPLPPMFSLGYHQCRWNYNDQTDVLNVDKMMDQHDIPYDVIWLDIEHTDDKKYFTWDKTRFPNPDEMVDKLDVKSRKLVTVIDPHIKRVSGWDLYEEGLSSDVYVKKSDGSTVYDGWCWPGSSVWPDFNDASVREWWAKRYLSYEGSRINNTFTWNDMGEPSIFNGPEVTMEKDAIHHNNLENREIHNLYGLQVHRASWEGQLLRSNNLERPFILTRAFFAGSQRFGAVWTGDNTADWGHLKATTPMLLSLSVTGITFCGADVGGFFGNPDNELLTRWYQAGSFHPFFRAHAHLDTKRREPYLLPEENIRIIRSAIQERYKLLPYWYTLFYTSETTNAPVLSPMWSYFPKDVANFNIDDQFMIGPAILVKPVTDAGATSIDVYLPPDLWYLHSTWTSYEGGRSINIPVTLSTIPVFYRGGSIVPRKERVRRASYLGRYDPYTFLVFLNHDQTAKGDLYIDDLHTLQYKTANIYEYYSITFDDSFQLSMKTQSTKVSDLRSKLERVVICGLKEKPQKIVYTQHGSSKSIDLEFFYMSERLLLIIRNPGVIIGNDWKIQLSYNKQEL